MDNKKGSLFGITYEDFLFTEDSSILTVEGMLEAFRKAYRNEGGQLSSNINFLVSPRMYDQLILEYNKDCSCDDCDCDSKTKCEDKCTCDTLLGGCTCGFIERERERNRKKEEQDE